MLLSFGLLIGNDELIWLIDGRAWYQIRIAPDRELLDHIEKIGTGTWRENRSGIARKTFRQ